ncbi:MAG TPA: SusC/RagA family TonB-linked outer membrane protein [Longimicrobiales bacterium]|nr:SusC/RagA family TonB-linked outer membrane protein [Longimicrobiales bacterium]
MPRWMLRCATSLALALMTTGLAAAQQVGTITGRVTQAGSDQPVQGAQVQLVGTTRGAMSDGAGRYVIQDVPAGNHTVRVQFLGYGSADREATVTAGGTATVDFELRTEAIKLDPVVVTALGIAREERGLGYAVQSVGKAELERTPEINLVQALQGQTAGVQVVQSSGRPGATSRIDIRGQGTFTGSGQPLFIIDGVPVSTDLDNEGMNPLGTGSAGSRAMDFDMNNVAEISVLRGAAATALYGSRASNGAVLITTKQGTVGSSLRFDYSTSASFATPIIDGYITDWTAGRDRFFCDGRLQSQGGYCEPGYPRTSGFETSTLGGSGYPNWGPHRDSIPAHVISAVGNVNINDARSQYYQTAQSMEHALRASGSVGNAGAYTFGIAYLDQGDITPTGGLERLNLSANVNLRFSDYLRSNTSVQRISTHNPWPEDSWNGIHHTLLNIPASIDIREGYLEDGSPVMWGSNSPHPEWVANNEYMESNVDRWIVSQQFAIDMPGNLTLANRWGLDTYQDDRRQYRNERPWRTAAGLTSGATRQEKINRYQINNDLTLSLGNTPLGGNFAVSGMVGGNLWMTERDRVTGTGSRIVIPDYYNIENFENQNVFADLPEQRRLLGLYGQATVDYQDWAYLTLTGRNDWSSTLPTHANSYFYPSASLGLIFTDALNMQSNLLNYGKLRLSYAQVGNDAPAYSLASTYNSGFAPGSHFGHYQFDPTTISFPFRDQVGFIQSTQLGNPNIKPESTREYEVGLEMRLLNNRARLDVSYYNKKSFDQIFRVPSSSASGYNTIVRNAGDLRNTGFEVSVRGRPIETEDFTFDVLANWTRNRNEVLELAPGIDNIRLAGYSWPSIRIMEGLPYGVIWGYGFQRNCVEATSAICFSNQPVGALLIGDENCISDRGGSCHGLPIRTQSQLPLGEALPNWLANFTTDMRYKALGLSSMWDIRNGSQILNFEIQYTTGRTGRHIFTNSRYEETVVDGVNVNTGQPNDVVLVKDPQYFELMYGYDRHENQIEPGGFVKLRQVTFSLDVPPNLIGRFGVNNGTLFVTGRNLGVWSDFSMGDPESDVYGGSSGATQFFRQFPAPQTRGWTIGFRASF